MSFETGAFESNHTRITLPNGKPGTIDNQGYALEDIGSGLWVEWFDGKRRTVVDERMRDLPQAIAEKIIERLGKQDEQKSLCV